MSMRAQKHFVQGKCFLLQRCMMDWKTAILGNIILAVSNSTLICDGRFIKRCAMLSTLFCMTGHSVNVLPLDITLKPCILC
jgi:hypothetical protein